MTKHDSDEIMAVMRALNYRIWPDIVDDAITALDSHRAPAIRAAVDDLVGQVNAFGWDDKNSKRCVRKLLAICGITNEQESV